jgi:predicted transcriptional regulator
MARGINPGHEQARGIINELIAGGMSQNSIAKYLGRDSSLVSQIRKGKPKGASFVSALKNLQAETATQGTSETIRDIRAGETAATLERRKGKGGEEAKVRRGIHKVTTKSGSEHYHCTSRCGDKTLLKTVDKASKNGSRNIRWSITFKEVRDKSDKVMKNHKLYGQMPEGWSIDDFYDQLVSPDEYAGWDEPDAKTGTPDVRGMLTALVLDQNSEFISSATGAYEYHIYGADR